MTEISDTLIAIGERAKTASRALRLATSDQKNQMLNAIAQELRAAASIILSANAIDLEKGREAGLSSALLDRLELTPSRIEAMAQGVAAIADLPEPCHRVLAEWDRPNGLHIRRVSVPLGVLAVIFESRPNVTADASALSIKSGNAVILRGGSDSFESSKMIVEAIHRGITLTDLPKDCVQMVPTTDRHAIDQLLTMDKYIDVIIPRGGVGLVEHVKTQSRIPLFEHLHGICHTYVHRQADLALALPIVLNAKLRRPGICGATETLLVDRDVLLTHGRPIIEALLNENCEVRGDLEFQALDSRIRPATPQDWDTEYLDRIINAKVVASLDDAILHINTHGSRHTDAIITANAAMADYFIQRVDSAIAMHNTSTQFADGGEFGMGAEIGIATGKLHARGPVGVEQLTTFHYEVLGTGQLRPVS